MQPHGGAAGPARRGVPGRHRVVRVVVVWLVTAAVVGLLGWLLPGVAVTSAGAALEAAALLGLINALVWPIFAYFALPLAVLTLGAAAIVLNGAAVAFAAYLIPGVEVRDLWTAIVVALVLTLVNAGLTTLLTLDDEDVYYRRVIRRAARKVRPGGVSDVPGVLFVQIDGLGMAVLRRAVRDGNAPALARWLASGSHRLLGWERVRMAALAESRPTPSSCTHQTYLPRPIPSGAPTNFTSYSAGGWPTSATTPSPIRAPNLPPAGRATHCFLVVSQTADPRGQRRAREQKILT